MELEHELRLTSDELLGRLERLHALELEKRTLTPGSARFRKIAREIERLATGIFNTTVEQEQLGQEAGALLETAGTAVRAIDDVEPRRDLHLILGEWRAAERRLSVAAHGTPEHLEAQAAVQRLRMEYRDTSGVALREANGDS